MLCKSELLNLFKSELKRNELELPESWTTERVFLTLFFLHALRCKSVERGMDLLINDFQEIVGGDFLTKQWLRYGVDKIAEDEGFDEAIRVFFKKLTELFVLEDDVFYTDGHFSAYYGKQKLPKGYDTKKKSAHRGRNNIYLHNTNGEVLYFFESPTNTTLSVDIEDLVKNMESDLEIELKGKTLMFDRGGYSSKAFKFLKKKKMYWTTYLKNRKKERKIPIEDFKKYKVNEVIEYKIYEGELPEGSAGKVRKIIFLGDDDRQIPILTTNPYMKAEEVVFLLQRRWREENCFKYMIKHFGMDLLTTYKPKQAPDKIIESTNPERKEINKKINKKKRELETLRSELAKKILKENKEKKLDALLEQEKKLNLELKNVEVDLDYLLRQREMIPTKQQKNLKDEHVIIKEKRRLFVNAIKVLNYNSEKWLQSILKKYYPKEDETLVTLQALWNIPGRIYRTSSTVRVELEPMNTLAKRSGIAKMLEELNKNNMLRMPDGKKMDVVITC